MLKNSVPLVLTCLGICVGASLIPGQPAPPPVKSKVQLPGVDVDKEKVDDADKIEKKMFPDGFVHDFGKVQRGAQVYHVFRIVNTSNVPLQIRSVRLS